MDRTTVGRSAVPFELPVDRSKIRELALATRLTRPEYLTATRPCVPPTFFTTMFGWMQPENDPWTFLQVDPLHSVQGSQEFEFTDALPSAGDVFVGQSIVESITRKTLRDGRRADFAVIRTDFTDRDQPGPPRVRTRLTVAEFVPDGATEDPGAATPAGAVTPPDPAAPPEPARPVDPPDLGDLGGLPDPPEPRCIGPLTLLDIVRYEGASGHYNPVHFDHEVAREAGLERPFAVGMQLAGYLATWATDWLGPVGVRRIWFRFARQVWLGEEVTVGGSLVSSNPATAEVALRCAVGPQPAVVGGAVFAR